MLPMQHVKQQSEDAALLLAIKDTETNALRQQLSQLSEDFQRNLAVLSSRDEEVSNLRGTIDALRSLLSEKQDLFLQFQGQVQELELLRVQETQQRLVLEQLLETKTAEWQQHQEAASQGRQAELAALQQQLEEAEDKFTAQLLRARQTALDDSLHLSTQQKAALERSAENMQRLQQQVDSLTSALEVKNSELQAAHKQLATAMDASQQLDITHNKAMAAKDQLITELKQQVQQQACSIDTTAAEHDSNMSKLIMSLNQLQESCQTQVQEVQEYSLTQKQLQEEAKVLKGQLREQETLVTKLQVEKGILESALQHEVTAQAGAQTQLNMFQAKLSEAVAELEQRCSAAEFRASQLRAQLVEKRSCLVDAVVEQANSSSPQLAAGLAESMEADRLQTQAELHMAQDRSRSLSAQLALIRSTLIPLLSVSATATTAGTRSPEQPANGAMSALAQLMKTRSPAVQLRGQSPLVAAVHNTPPGLNKANVSLAVSPAAADRLSSADGVQCHHSSPSWVPSAIAAAPGSSRGGTLAGLVTELQVDVDKLQQQLHNSRRQLKWNDKPNSAGAHRCSAVELQQSNISSLEAGQQQQDSDAQQQALPIFTKDVSSQGSVGVDSATPVKQLHDALWYLLDKTEQLSAENGALRSQLLQDDASTGHTLSAAFHQQECQGKQQGQQQQQQQRLHVSKKPSNCCCPAGRSTCTCMGLQTDMSPSLKPSSFGNRCRNHLGSRAATSSESVESHPSRVRSASKHAAEALSLAVNGVLKVAGADAAMESARHSRQERAAAAPQQHRSPGKVAMMTAEKALEHLRQQHHRSLGRANSVDSSTTGASCETIDSATSFVTVHEQSIVNAACRSNSHANNSKQLLEAILANNLTFNDTGKMLKGLSAAATNGMSHNSAPAHDEEVHNSHSSGHGRCCLSGKGFAAADSKIAGKSDLVQRQLHHIAELSPGRQRLLRALAASAAK